jgi:hypothetical protein
MAKLQNKTAEQSRFQLMGHRLPACIFPKLGELTGGKPYHQGSSRFFYDFVAKFLNSQDHIGYRGQVLYFGMTQSHPDRIVESIRMLRSTEIEYFPG